jgi:hypothetical protein
MKRENGILTLGEQNRPAPIWNVVQKPMKVGFVFRAGVFVRPID